MSDSGDADDWDWEESDWDEDPYPEDIMISEDAMPQLTNQVSYFVMDEKAIAKKQMEAIEGLRDTLGLNRT